MTTFKTEFDALTSKYPSEKDTIRRLKRWMAEELDSENVEHRVYSVDRLLSVIEPQSSWQFLKILGDLTNDGLLKQFVRLHSESGTGLGDYERFEDVPEKTLDITVDKEIEVTPDDLQVLYKFAVNE